MRLSANQPRLWLAGIFPALLGLGLLLALEPYQPYSEESAEFRRSRGLAGLGNFAPPFRLRDVTEQAKVRARHQNPLTDPSGNFINEAPRFQFNGAAAAAVDIDQDGWMDLYVANGARGSAPWLWRNNHDGTFTDIAEKWGLAGVNAGDKQSGAAAFFDFDNDGDKDLFLHRLSGCSTFFENKGGKFVERQDLLGGAPICGFGTALNVFDYDNDGYLDIVAGFWSQEGFDMLHPKGTAVLWDSTQHATNGSRIFLMHNEGGKRFRDITASAGLERVRYWLWGAGILDIDDDGRPDLFFSNGWGRDRMFLNTGKGFREQSRRLVSGSANSSMGVEIGDFDNDMHDDVFTGVIYERRHINWGNNFYLNRGLASMENSSHDNGTFNCGWSWGPKSVDFDLDGRPEIYLTNGFISRETKELYEFEAMVSMAAPLRIQADDRTRSTKLQHASYAGHQRDCLFYFAKGRYWDIGPLVGVEQRRDGRAVVPFDFDNDGRPDLFVANQNNYPLLYHNEEAGPGAGNSWIGLQLEVAAGAKVNRDAVGTRVFLLENGKPSQKRSLYPNNGYLAQSDPRILFGLGPRRSSEGLELLVLWPDGKEQQVKVKELNRYLRVVRAR